jgi:methionyl-tRNA formyltransferase
MKVVFLGGKDIGARCLELLLLYIKGKALEVIAVGASPRGAALRKVTTDNGITLFNDADDIPECDFMISVQYHDILKQHHIDRAKEIAVNLHMAPLPEYRGCNQFTIALLNEDTTFGVTLHQLDVGIDSGDMLFEHRFDIPPKAWVNDLVQLAGVHSVDLFANSLDSLFAQTYTKVTQQSLIAQRGTSLNYRKGINKLKKIDLNNPKEHIQRQIRATSMPGFPGPYFEVEGVRFTVKREY